MVIAKDFATTREQVNPAQQQRKDFVLTSAGSIAGHVTFREGHDPDDGVNVRMHSVLPGPNGVLEYSDFLGSDDTFFEIREIIPGNYLLEIDLDGDEINEVFSISVQGKEELMLELE